MGNVTRGLTKRLKQEMLEQYRDLIPCDKEVTTFFASEVRTGRVDRLAPAATLRAGEPYVAVVFDELSPYPGTKYMPLRVVLGEDESYVAPFQRGVSPGVRSRIVEVLRCMEVPPWDERYRETFKEFGEEVEE